MRDGVIDYLCNGFTPDRWHIWEGVLPNTRVKMRQAPGDTLMAPEEMVAMMDELGIATVLLVTTDIGAHGKLDPSDFEHVANHWDETEQLVGKYPGRFAALAVINPSRGMAGVRETRARLAEPWVAGLYLHTHSWDRRFDHADYYPYYALCSELAVPIGMQAGYSGGLMASECGHAITIDRPALYFPDTQFILSHTGWPWVDETIAMALKFPNVFLGTASYPPRHWNASLRDFIKGPGKHKTLFGTNFPTAGFRHTLGQIPELGLRPEVEAALLSGNARKIFSRLSK